MSEDKPSVADQVLAILERERAAGRQFIELSEANQAFLEDLASGKARPKAAEPAPAAPPAKAETADPTPAPRAPDPPVEPPRREPQPQPRREPERPVPAARQPEPPPRREPEPAAPPPRREPEPPRAAPPAARGPRVADGLNAGDRLPDLSAHSLDSLADWMADCRRCGLCERRRQVVFGVGNPDAELMFIGEGPGAEEDAQGLPFVGPAGQLLDKIIGAMTWQRDEVYIANIVKCRPPGNRNPEPDEATACLPFLERQIQLVQPQAIVLLGGQALKFLMPQVRSGITRTRGTWLEYGQIPVMPTFHPSFLLRNPAAKKEVWTDMQAVMRRLGREPGRGR